MKWLFLITSLLLIVAIFGDNFIKEEEMTECFFKLVCELDKFEEFYDIREVAGPELTLKGAIWMSEITGIENPSITREFWVQAFDIFCVASDEEKEKLFKGFFQLSGEYMMEECRNPTSVYCVKSDLSAAAFLDILVKYKANGVCRTLGQNTGELVPGGLDNFKSSPIG